MRALIYTTIVLKFLEKESKGIVEHQFLILKINCMAYMLEVDHYIGIGNALLANYIWKKIGVKRIKGKKITLIYGSIILHFLQL